MWVTWDGRCVSPQQPQGQSAPLTVDMGESKHQQEGSTEQDVGRASITQIQGQGDREFHPQTPRDPVPALGSPSPEHREKENPQWDTPSPLQGWEALPQEDFLFLVPHKTTGARSGKPRQAKQ